MTSRPKLRQQLQIWRPAALVLVIGSALSASLWRVLEHRQAQMVQDRVHQQVHLFTSSLEQRLYAYADQLRGMRPLLEWQSASGHDIFAALRQTPSVDARYPGVEVVSVVRKMSATQYAAHRKKLLREVPDTERVHEVWMPEMSLHTTSYYVIDEVWPIHAKHPLSGFDAMRQEAVKAQLQRMHATSESLLSAPLMLHESQDGAIGVLVSVPLHEKAQGVQAGALLGALNISLRADALVDHFRHRGMLQNLRMQVHDTTPEDVVQPALLYQSEDWAEVVPNTSVVQRTLNILGRQWTLTFAPQGNVLSAVERWFPALVALSALGVTILLAVVVLLLSMQRTRAQMQAKAKHNLLRERTDRLKVLFHQSAVGVAEIEPATGRYINANTRFVDIVGFSSQELEAMDIYDIIHADDRDECRRMEQLLSDGHIKHFSITQRVLRADGGVVWVEKWVSPLLDNDGKPAGRHFVLLMDVTERKLMQERLQAREAYSSEMLRYMPVGLVVVGAQGNIEFVNHQFESMTGWAQADLTDESTLWRHLCVDAQQHSELLQRLNAGRCEVVPTGVNMPATEYLLRSKNGQEMTIEVSGRFLGGRILLSFVDVSPRKAAEEEIHWLGFYDTLTKLPNRRLLLNRLEEALTRSQRSNGNKGALLLLDIDNFKSLNETLGHDHGDALLGLVATRLSGCIAGRHTLARQGGDEFAVVLEDLPADPLEAGRRTEQVGGAILEALRTPFYLGNQDFHVTVSMGAVVFCGQGDSVEELLKRADVALYQAKSAGRDTLQFFDPSMQKAVTARVEMEKNIRTALERHEFDLFFQPQVQCDKVVGAEALLRWNHPTKGFIPPSVFVPAAEESGLILPLGEWVLFAACRQLAQWSKDPGLAGLTMSVNVSPRQFYQSNFVEQVQQALEVSGAKPHLLELELTEGMLLTDVEDTIHKMVQLKAMGVIFSLDDFGTGYSSLSYLKRLPLDKLKIDQSFVREVETSANDAAIARSIIALGHSLGLQVIAEGVETQAQRAFLAANGCFYWQGFFFSQPQPVDKFEAWTHAYSTQRNADGTHAQAQAQA